MGRSLQWRWPGEGEPGGAGGGRTLPTPAEATAGPLTYLGCRSCLRLRPPTAQATALRGAKDLWAVLGQAPPPTQSVGPSMLALLLLALLGQASGDLKQAAMRGRLDLIAEELGASAATDTHTPRAPPTRPCPSQPARCRPRRGQRHQRERHRIPGRDGAAGGCARRQSGERARTAGARGRPGAPEPRRHDPTPCRRVSKPARRHRGAD